MARIDLTGAGSAPHYSCAENTETVPPSPACIDSADTHRSSTLMDRLTNALAQFDFRKARTLVAEAATDESVETWETIELGKARISLAAGDHIAAQAILVMAIEKVPTDQRLRTFLTEVMMAAGRATDVRPVLLHLGAASNGLTVAEKDLELQKT